MSHVHLFVSLLLVILAHLFLSLSLVDYVQNRCPWFWQTNWSSWYPCDCDIRGESRRGETTTGGEIQTVPELCGRIRETSEA